MSNSNISIRAFKFYVAYYKLHATNCMQYLACDMLHIRKLLWKPNICMEATRKKDFWFQNSE
jgi:hypothetical protein